MIYTVHIYIAETVSADWKDWMIRVHIPDVMRTRCFDGSKLSVLVEPVKEGFQGFQVQYFTTAAHFVLYQSNFAERLQKEHTDKYAGQFSASRFITKDA